MNRTAHFGKTTIHGKKALILYGENGDTVAEILTGCRTPSELKELLKAFIKAVEAEGGGKPDSLRAAFHEGWISGYNAPEHGTSDADWSRSETRTQIGD